MDVPATPSWRYWPTAAGAISYDKTALWLHTLENYLGWPTLRRWLADDREGLRLHRHLMSAAQAWDALDRDPGERCTCG